MVFFLLPVRPEIFLTAVQIELAHRCEMTARCRRQTNYLQPRLKTPTDSRTKGAGVWGAVVSCQSSARLPSPLLGCSWCAEAVGIPRDTPCKGAVGEAHAHPAARRGWGMLKTTEPRGRRCPFEGDTPRMTELDLAGGMALLGIPSGFAKDGSGMGPCHPEGVTTGGFSAWNQAGRRVGDIAEVPPPPPPPFIRPALAGAAAPALPASSRGQPGLPAGFHSFIAVCDLCGPSHVRAGRLLQLQMAPGKELSPL